MPILSFYTSMGLCTHYIVRIWHQIWYIEKIYTQQKMSIWPITMKNKHMAECIVDYILKNMHFFPVVEFFWHFKIHQRQFVQTVQSLIMNIQLLGSILFSKKDDITPTLLFGNLSKIDSSLLDKHIARWSDYSFFFENLENVLQCYVFGRS